MHIGPLRLAQLKNMHLFSKAFLSTVRYDVLGHQENIRRSVQQKTEITKETNANYSVQT